MKRFIALLLCIMLAFSLFACEAGDNGSETESGTDDTTAKVDGNVPVIKIGNSEITFAEFNLHYYSLPMTIASNYSYYYGDQYKQVLLQNEGLDIDSSFKDQDCPYYDGSYHDYFLSMAKSTCTDFAAYMNYAEENGIEFTDEERESLDADIERIVSNATQYSMSLSEYFGDPTGLTTEDVVRSYYTKLSLAKKARTAFIESLAIDDAKIAEEYKRDPAPYSTVDFLAYTVKADGEKIKNEDVMTYADEIASSKTQSEFIQHVKDIYVDLLGNTDFDESAMHYRNIAYSADGEDAIEWLFKEGKVGECYKAYSSEDNLCSVYMITKAPHFADYTTKSVRHILFKTSNYDSAEAALAEAQRVLEEYNKNPTEDNFAALANEYSDDRQPSYDDDGNVTDERGEKTDGGLYENMKLGTYVINFESWAFDEARKPGDTGIVESSYGYHIMYFVGDGEKVTTASEKIRNALLAAALADYEAKFEVMYDEVFINANI